MEFPKKFGETLMLLFLLVHVAGPAPLGDSIGRFGRPPRMRGCTYQSDYIKNGERIFTPNPCYNCSCVNSTVMCKIQTCPFVKPSGEHCIAVKNETECCPTFHCPKGCFVNGTHYANGARMPSDTGNPCEICHCIRNRASCVVEECELEIEGCSPIYKPGQCCPSRYNCSAGTNSTSHRFTLSAPVPYGEQSTTQTNTTDSVEIKSELQNSSSTVPSIMQSDALPHEYPTVATTSDETTNTPMETETSTSTVSASFYDFSTNAITEKETLPQVSMKTPETLVSHSESTPQKFNTTALSPNLTTSDSESIMLLRNNITLANLDLYEKTTVPTLISDVEWGQIAHTSNTSVSSLSFNNSNATDSFTSGSQEGIILVSQTGNLYTSKDNNLETTGAISNENLQENSPSTKNRPSGSVVDSHLIHFTESNTPDSNTTSTSTESSTSKNEKHPLPGTVLTKLIMESSIPATQNPLDLFNKNITADYLPAIKENVEATAIVPFAENNQSTNPENITVFVTNTSPTVNNSNDKVGSNVSDVQEDINKDNKDVSKYFTSINDSIILEDSTLNTEDEEAIKNDSDITFSTDEIYTTPSSFPLEFSDIAITKLTNISDSQISQEGSEINKTGDSAYSTLKWFFDDLKSPSVSTLNDTNQDNNTFPPSKFIIQSSITATQKPLNLTMKYITADYLSSIKENVTEFSDIPTTKLTNIPHSQISEESTETNETGKKAFLSLTSLFGHLTPPLASTLNGTNQYNKTYVPSSGDTVFYTESTTDVYDSSTSGNPHFEKELLSDFYTVKEEKLNDTDSVSPEPDSITYPDVSSSLSQVSHEDNFNLTSSLASTLNGSNQDDKTYFPSSADKVLNTASTDDVYDSPTSSNPHFAEVHNITFTDIPEEDNLTTNTELLSDFNLVQEIKLNDTDSVSPVPDSTSYPDVPSSLSQVNHEDTFNLTSSLTSTFNGSNQDNKTYFPSSADTDLYTASTDDVYDSPTSGNPHLEEMHNITFTDIPEEGNLTTSTELLSDFFTIQKEKFNDTDSVSPDPDSTSYSDVSSSLSQVSHEDTFNLTSSIASTLHVSNQDNKTYFPSSADTVYTTSSYDVYDSPTSGNPHFEEMHNITSTDTPEEGNLTTSTELLSDFNLVQEIKLNDTDSVLPDPDSTSYPDVSSSLSQVSHEDTFNLTSPLASTLNGSYQDNKTYSPSSADTDLYTESIDDVYDSPTSGDPHFEEMHNIIFTDIPEEDNLTTSTELLSDFYTVQEEKLNDTDSVSPDPESTSYPDVSSSLSQVSHEDTFNLTSSLASTFNVSNQDNKTYFPSSADTVYTTSSYDEYDSPTSGNPHFEEMHNITSTDTPEEGNLTTSKELLSDFNLVQEIKLNDTDSVSPDSDSTLIPHASSSVSQVGHEGNFTEVSDTFTAKDIIFNITTMSKYVPNAATVKNTTFNQTQEKSPIKPDITSFNTDIDFVEQTSYPSIDEIDFIGTSINLNDQTPNVDRNFTETHKIPSTPNSTITRHQDFDVDESNIKHFEIENITSAVFKNKQMLNETKNITKDVDIDSIHSTANRLLNGTKNISKDFEVANIASTIIPKDELLNKSENITKYIQIDYVSTAVIPKFQNLKEIENNTKDIETDSVPSIVTPKLDNINKKKNITGDFIEEIRLTPEAIIKDDNQTESDFFSSIISDELVRVTTEKFLSNGQKHSVTSSATPEGITYPLQDEIVKALSTIFPSSPGNMVYESHPYFFTDNRNYGKQSSEGSGACYLGDKIYRPSEQMPSDDSCESCFCSKGERTCLQHTCLPPINSCYSIPVKGFCCPRFHCPVQEISLRHSSSNTTTSTQPLDKNTHTLTQNPTPGCQIEGISYRLNEIVLRSSDPCMLCRCEKVGIMVCQPRSCIPDASMLQDIAEASSRRRK